MKLVDLSRKLLKDLLTYQDRFATSVICIKKIEGMWEVHAESHTVTRYPIELLDLAIERFLWLEDRTAVPDYCFAKHAPYVLDDDLD